ncbi:YceI family protein [Tessaracoccus sp. MC1679]|uniref:YceI family protein n=1 Tax=Tessaracoccus sp. MC1679 TaxID=2760313 RepID=UPI0016038D0F|nr:YceI family protein [Tessaracoccus sp. MC1679]
MTATALNQLAGTYTIDPSHTEIGFTARHAMVTKVRGAFTDFSGTASTGAGLSSPALDMTINAASVSTGSADRDGHLVSADFFDVEQYPTIRFASSSVTAPADDTLRVEGDLTIKDVTRPVVIDFDYDGVATDPFGNERVGLSGSVMVNRKDFGLVWNAALETGGVLVSENVNLVFEVSAIKDPEASAEAVADETVAVEPAPAPAAPATEQAAPAAQAGFAGWLKRLFA